MTASVLRAEAILIDGVQGEPAPPRDAASEERTFGKAAQDRVLPKAPGRSGR